MINKPNQITASINCFGGSFCFKNTEHPNHKISTDINLSFKLKYTPLAEL